jgi:hypothetical protein
VAVLEVQPSIVFRPLRVDAWETAPLLPDLVHAVESSGGEAGPPATIGPPLPKFAERVLGRADKLVDLSACSGRAARGGTEIGGTGAVQ